MVRQRSERNRDPAAGIKNRSFGLSKKANTFYRQYGCEVIVLSRVGNRPWKGFQSHAGLLQRLARQVIPEDQLLTPADFPAPSPPTHDGNISDVPFMPSPPSISSQLSGITEGSTQSSSPFSSPQLSSTTEESIQSSSPFSSSQFSGTTEESMLPSSPFNSSQFSGTTERSTQSASPSSSPQLSAQPEEAADSTPPLHSSSGPSLLQLPSSLLSKRVQSGVTKCPSILLPGQHRAVHRLSQGGKDVQSLLNVAHSHGSRGCGLRQPGPLRPGIASPS
ncbi:hypothetical protein B0J13DRAFT_166690 [Dactylonectria estremocensis]|uniref:MADS-box domain-containing protein n=1 Tax=Dactylonectria estremocensis TaxID=1079267 RepID=A0A9P9DJ30_9HYPO|nr:hypothetical protein B0J13DRAFT_166690 [Dactylonectria estremocensis]